MKKRFIGKRVLQPFFERLFRISLKGMNYGVGGRTSSSGEAFVVKLVKNTLNKELVVFDIGANKGQYSAMLSDILTNKDLIYAFEPTKEAFKALKARQLKNVFCHNVALSNSIGTAIIYYNTPGATRASMKKAEHKHYGITLDQEEEIETLTLDQFCKSNAIEHIDFCKIDVEGHEMHVLKGAENLISGNKISFIQFEFGLASTQSGSYLKDFFSFLDNYKIYRILQDGLYPITYNERYEIFLVTNYLAIHKDIANTR